MPVRTNEQRKAEKRAQILSAAKTVFQEKGFSDVTMKDVIDEAGISRGGIYLYFSSIDALFTEVLSERNSHSLQDMQDAIAAGTAFEQLWQIYLAGQKERLLHRVDSGLLQAVYEYYFTHKTAADHAFQRAQFALIKETIMVMLQQGVAQGVLAEQPLAAIAEHIMIVIEGLSVMALTGGIDEARIDAQFSQLNQLLPRTAG
ncbi:TetR/AcrR family transcriptional regulator [Lacticaseibacillus mingshuiensis]|uniref:TetR/AcrR family transcriptional regulator n=1 Tax=Lacticaseibacillus mingshuiensis TaxID=2799574 RepID=UPI0019529530|nr:TetR/AcrR family transcriptional regulator [Lacticaseibacillus mingshuiensis]